MQTSYVTAPGAGALGELEDESAFPNSTTSWFFLDALDVQAGPETGPWSASATASPTAPTSTLNGDDRWPDVLARRLRCGRDRRWRWSTRASAATSVVGPAEYAPRQAVPGRPRPRCSGSTATCSALSGVTHVIWFEGINDFSADGDATFEQVRDGMRDGRQADRGRNCRGVKVIGATLTPVDRHHGRGPRLRPRSGAQAARAERLHPQQRRPVRRRGRLRQGHDRPKTGGLRPEFVPGSTIGGPGDGLHPNRAGYIAWATRSTCACCVRRRRRSRSRGRRRPRPLTPPAPA